MWSMVAVALAFEVQVGSDEAPTVDEAMAIDGATVVVVPAGTWSITRSVSARALTIRGAGASRTTLVVDSTLNASEAATLTFADLTLEEGEGRPAPLLTVDANVTLDRVAVLGHRSAVWVADGPLVQVGAAGTLLATDVELLRGVAREQAGALNVAGTAVLEGVQIAGTVVEDVGGEAVMVDVSGDLTLRNCVLTGMTGAGRHVLRARADSQVLVQGTRVVGNTTTSGSTLYASGANVTIRDSEFTSNTATGTAGVQIDGQGTLIVTRSNFRDNQGVRGTVRCADSSCTVEDGIFLANRVSEAGAAMVFEAGSTGSITGTSLCHNRAPRDGGALLLQANPITVRRNYFVDNRGGAVAVVGSALIEQSVFAANFAASGVAVRGDAFAIVDSVFTDHMLDEGSTDTLFRAGDALSGVVQSSAIHGNDAPSTGVRVEGGFTTAELHVRPLNRCRFEDARLLPGSPLIGATSTGGDIGAFPSGEGEDVDEDGTIRRYDCDDDDPAVIEPVEVWSGDRDGDGHADPADPGEVSVSCPGPRRAPVIDDCNDGDPQVYPGAVEDIGGLDLNCDGFVDPAVVPGRGCATSPDGWTGMLAMLLALTARRRSASGVDTEP
jgi:hypothetical protein